MRKRLGGLGTLLVLGLGMGLVRGGPPTGEATPPAKPGATNQQLPEETILSAWLAAAANGGKPYDVGKELLDTIEASLSQPEDSDKSDKASGKASDKGPRKDFGKDQSKSQNPPDKKCDPLDEEFSELAKSDYDIKFTIAIVPDPVHTHLSLFFDRTMDAIQQGAQQAHWIFDRAVMPWDSQEHPESTDFRIRLQQEDYQGDKEDLPGLMIFRPNNPDPSDPKQLKTLLFIFVVGETPTGGVTKKQFSRAVGWIETIAKAKDPAAENPLRIIGPTFSGSLYSLAQLTRNNVTHAQFNGVVIRSGTVSSWETTRWFYKQWLSGNPSVDFATFQESDRYMLRSFVEFEKRRGYDPTQIAVLTEDETAYGNVRRIASDSAAGALKTPEEATLRTDEGSVLHLYFPRDISQLRSAYQQGFQQQASSSSDSYQVRSTLPINLQDNGSDDDSVQQYAHSQTPLSQESILLGIVAAIRLHDIKFVVLQATNPMDTVFLSAFLKKSDSAARVVAMPADLLLSRDVDDMSLLHGVMALTTYSLLPVLADEVAIPISPRVEDARVSHIFPNAYAAGTYNATLSQITCFTAPPHTTGCDVSHPASDLPTARYAEYGWPSLGGVPKPTTEPLAPAVWLTVLGRGGFWPLAILGSGGDKQGNLESSLRRIDPDPRPTPGHPECCGYKAREFKPRRRTFFGLTFGFVLMLVVAYLWLLRNGSIFASTSFMKMLAPIADPCRARLIMVIGWLLLLALLLLAWPWVVWWELGCLPKLYVLVAGIAIALLYGVCTQELNRRGELRTRRVFTVVAAVLILCFVILYSVPGHSQNPFLYRYVYITSGVSPLLPFLCLLGAGIWWGWFSLSGLVLVDNRRPKLPLNCDLPTIGPSDHIAPSVMSGLWPTEELVAKLMHVVRPCSWDPRIYIPLLTLLGISLCALDYGHPLLSLETRHFEWAYAISLAVVTVALFGTLFRMLVIWLECRKILTVIDRFPLRRAFAELNFNMEPFWRMGGGEQADSSRLGTRQLETLEQLNREAGSTFAKAKSEADREGAKHLLADIRTTLATRNDLRKKFVDFSKAQDLPVQAAQPDFEKLIHSYEDLQNNIARTCAAVLKYLQPKWYTKEGLIFGEVDSKDKGDDKNITVICGKDDQDETEPSLLTRLAERFVALVYLNFIHSVMLRMRTLSITVAGLFVFLLLSVNSYPFEPGTALRSEAILILILIVGMVGFVSAQIHRDPILSLATQTKPGELGAAFWLRMGTFIALPLLSLLVSQFPALNNVVFSWLEPAANALK